MAVAGRRAGAGRGDHRTAGRHRDRQEQRDSRTRPPRIVRAHIVRARSLRAHIRQAQWPRMPGPGTPKLGDHRVHYLLGGPGPT